MQSDLVRKSKILGDQFLQFVNHSPSPFHAVDWCKNLLNKKGYQELSETSNW